MKVKVPVWMGLVHTAQPISCYIGARAKLITMAILGFT